MQALCAWILDRWPGLISQYLFDEVLVLYLHGPVDSWLATIIVSAGGYRLENMHSFRTLDPVDPEFFDKLVGFIDRSIELTTRCYQRADPIELKSWNCGDD